MKMRFVAVAVVVLFLLVGCGGGSNDPVVGTDTTAGNDPEVPQILTASLGGSVNGFLSAFQGQDVVDLVAVVTDIERAELAFSLPNGPPGSSIDQEGVFRYAVPMELAPGTTLPVQIRVTHEDTDQSITLEESIYVMERKVVAKKAFNSAGGELSDEWGEIVVSVPAGAVPTQTNIEIIRSRNAHGSVVVTIESDEPINNLVEIRFADPELLMLKDSASVSQVAPAEVRSRTVSALAAVQVQAPFNLFKSFGMFWNPLYDLTRINGLGNRVPDPSKIKIPLIGASKFTSEVASQLSSYRDPSARDSSGRLKLEGTTPVLLVHGYNQSREGLGGGSETWGNLPSLIQGIDSKYSVFEFQWISAARFEDVAAELGMAVHRLHKLTGKNVHIVAHSFGGILTRTLLQGMATKFPYPATGGKVASVITVGTPHSGIFAANETRNNKVFLSGQDSLAFLGCGQISCYQMGAYVPFVIKEKEVFQLSARYGDFLVELSDLDKNKLPSDIPIKVLIGLTDTQVTREEGGLTIKGLHVLSNGDGLIRFSGQRFYAGSNDTTPLLQDGHIAETVLRFGNNSKPGDINHDPHNHVGYRHNSSVFPFKAIPMVEVKSDQHDAFKEIEAWLKVPGATGTAALVPNTTLSIEVKDAVTGTAISGGKVTVKVHNSTEGEVTTDSSGKAIIQNVQFFANQIYTTVVSAGGYRPNSQTLVMRNTLLESPTSFGAVLLRPLASTTINPVIAQTPMSGSVGTTFVQWGTGFTPYGTAILHFRKPDGSEYPTQTVQLDSIGHFEISYTIPVDKPAGSYTWWAVDVATGISSYPPVTYEIHLTQPVDTYSLSGVIHSGSNSGPALSGATVSIAGLSSTSSLSGGFSINGIPAGKYAFSVSKLGYDTYTNPAYYVGSNQSGLSFYLQLHGGISGDVTTFVGSPENAGNSEGFGSDARFSQPTGISTDSKNLYIVDQGSVIRIVNISTKEVTTLQGEVGYSYQKVTTHNGYLYLTDQQHTIRKVAIDTGEVTILAGSAGKQGSVDGIGAEVRFDYPIGITTDGTNIYVADGGSFVNVGPASIRKVVISTGEVTTLASGSVGISSGLVTDGTCLYWLDFYGVVYKVVIATGEISAIANVPGGARGLSMDDMYIYVVYCNGVSKIMINTGVVTSIAGNGNVYDHGFADGNGGAAKFSYPSDVVNLGQYLYVLDMNNHVVRKVIK